MMEAAHECSGDMHTQQTADLPRSLLRSENACPSPREIKQEVKRHLQGKQELLRINVDIELLSTKKSWNDNVPGEICVLRQLGWVDNYWRTGWNNETILEDLSSLPGEVSYYLMDESIMGECVDDTMEYIYSSSGDCMATYSENGQAKVAGRCQFK